MAGKTRLQPGTCCGCSAASPCSGSFPIPARNLNLAISPPDNINGYLLSSTILNYPGLGGATSWTVCFCNTTSGPGTLSPGPCGTTGALWNDWAYGLGCVSGTTPPHFQVGLGPSPLCTPSTNLVTPVSYTASPFQLVYQITRGATTTTYTIT